MLSSILLSATMLLLASKPVQAFNCATHTFGSCEDTIVHWYDPDDGLICDPLDCGGGRAPPKTDVPGCANYKGTSTRAGSSYLSCFKTKELATSTKEAVVTASATSALPGTTHTSFSTTPIVTSTTSASSSHSSSSSILPSTISDGVVSSPPTITASSTSTSTSTTSPSTTSPPAISSAAVQNGTTVSSSRSSSISASASPNAGGRVSMDSIIAVGLGLVGVMALA